VALGIALVMAFPGKKEPFCSLMLPVEDGEGLPDVFGGPKCVLAQTPSAVLSPFAPLDTRCLRSEEISANTYLDIHLKKYLRYLYHL